MHVALGLVGIVHASASGADTESSPYRVGSKDQVVTQMLLRAVDRTVPTRAKRAEGRTAEGGTVRCSDGLDDNFIDCLRNAKHLEAHAGT